MLSIDVVEYIYEFISSIMSRAALALVHPRIAALHSKKIAPMLPLRSKSLYNYLLNNPTTPVNFSFNSFIPQGVPDVLIHQIIKANNLALMRYIITKTPRYGVHYNDIVQNYCFDSHYDIIVELMDQNVICKSTVLESSIVNCSARLLDLTLSKNAIIELDYELFSNIVKNDRLDIVEMLINRRYVNLHDLLKCAATLNNVEIVKIVLANINYNDMSKILLMAVSRDSVDVVAYLLRHYEITFDKRFDLIKSVKMFDLITSVYKIDDDLNITNICVAINHNAVALDMLGKHKEFISHDLRNIALKHDNVEVFQYIKASCQIGEYDAIDAVHFKASKCLDFILQRHKKYMYKVYLQLSYLTHPNIMNVYWKHTDESERNDVVVFLAKHRFYDLCLQAINEGYTKRALDIVLNVARNDPNPQKSAAFVKIHNALYIPRT